MKTENRFKFLQGLWKPNINLQKIINEISKVVILQKSEPLCVYDI